MMRTLTLVLVLSVCAVFAASTDLGAITPSGATAYIPSAPNGGLDIVYMTDDFSAGACVNGVATSPSYGWVAADDFVLADDTDLTKLTCWAINNPAPSGFYMRFWEDTGGSGPGSELANAPATAVQTSTGVYLWGYLCYKYEITFDPSYSMDAGHYWWAFGMSSGFVYMLCEAHAYDYMVYFDYGGGGAGPWYSSQYMWGEAYDFFQTVEGDTGPPDLDPPYVTGMDPDDGQADVPTDSTIVFHCVDDLHPIDTTTIDFTVLDSTLSGDRFESTGAALGVHASPARTLPGDLVLDETNPMDVVCTWTGDDPFYEGVTITCTVAAGLADSKGNPMVDDFVWTFDTYSSAVTTTTWGAIKAEY